MAEAPHVPPEAEVRARWGAFAWTPANAEQARIIVSVVAERRQLAALGAMTIEFGDSD